MLSKLGEAKWKNAGNNALQPIPLLLTDHVLQFLIILCMVGLDVGIQTTPKGASKRPKSDPLIISNSIGLIVMLIWSLFAFRAVKYEDKNMAWLLTVVLPIMYILPVVDIVLGETC